MSVFMVSQLLIVVAIVSDIMSFQFKHKRHILMCLVVSGLLISAHFSLLEQWTAAGLMLLAAIRFFVTIFSHAKYLMWLFLVMSSGITLLTFAGPLSLVSLTGSALQTVAAFCSNDQRLRQTMFVGTCVWLLNNVLVESPTAVLMEVLFIASNLVGYYRFYGFRLSMAPRSNPLDSVS